MILQALHRLTEQEGLLPDPDFESKRVAFLVRVGPGGRLIGIEDTRETPPAQEGRKPGKPIAKRFSAPREPGRTSGDRALFFFDKAEYALGLDPETDPSKRRPAKKLARRFELFRDKVRACFEATDDEAAGAVLTFLEAVAEGREQPDLPEACASNDLFAFVFGTETRLVTERPKIQEYWRSLRQPADDAPRTRCLVTGEIAPVAEKHTILKKVPGAVSSGVPLVSFNSPAFESYGWSSNENAPISRGAAESYATALQRLIDPSFERVGEKLPRRGVHLASDTIVCFWTEENHELADVFAGLIEGGNPDQVSELYRSIWSGRKPHLDDPSAFYAVVLSGAQGRVVVRSWFRTTVAEAAESLAQHHADLQVVRNTPKPKKGTLPPVLPLSVLLRSLVPPGRDAQVPGHLAAGIIEAALDSHRLYPRSLLTRAIERFRNELCNDTWHDLQNRDARCSLIRAVLNRSRRRQDPTPTQEIESMMDPTNSEPGYLLGRLMAVIERLQQVALGNVNASVTDRFFGAASATPRVAFVRLLKNARHHARKAREADEKTARTGRWLEGQLDQLVSQFGVAQGGFPAHLDIEQQGLFILGFHQQRHWLWLPREQRDALKLDGSVALEET